MRKESIAIGKNVSLNIETLQIITGYQHRTKQNFSATLNSIIKEWDAISLQIQKLKDKEMLEKNIDHLYEIQKAKVLK